MKSLNNSPNNKRVKVQTKNKKSVKKLKHNNSKVEEEGELNESDELLSKKLKKDKCLNVHNKATKCLENTESTSENSTLEIIQGSLHLETPSEEIDENVKGIKNHKKDVDLNLSKPKSSKKKRMFIKTKVDSTDSETEVAPPKSRKCLQVNNEEYEPGMLSNQLQIKKFGDLILPWDSSFGLKLTSNVQGVNSNEDKSKKKTQVKINPLFDLSKRQNINPISAADSDDTVFVGNLPITIKIGDIKKLFRKCGVIRNAKLKHKEIKSTKLLINKQDSNNDNKYMNAKVKFTTAEGCQSALKLNGVIYEGRHLRVTLASEEGKSDPDRCVFVGNLAFGTQDDDLWKGFADCGEIESVRIIRDGQSGKGKGFGYINFKSADSIELALKKDGVNILNREVRVRKNSSNVYSQSDTVTVKRKKLKKRTRTVSKNKETDNDISEATSKNSVNNEDQHVKRKKSKKETFGS